MGALTQEQRVKKAHVWLMGNPKYCLYSGIFLLGESTVVDDVPTACTDGLNVRYGRKFVGKLTDAQLRGLILHETMHKAFRHLTVWKNLYKQDARMANMACDYVINLMITDSDPQGRDVTLPEGGCLDEKYRGMDAQQVFKLLQKEQKEQQDANNGDSGDNSDSADSGGSGDNGEPQGFDEHDWEGAAQRTDQQEKEIAKQVDNALRQGTMLASRRGAKGEAMGVLKALEPQVNWREVLQEFITSIASGKDMSTWRKPARRWIDQGVYLPSTVSESMGKIVVALDTSGSISNHELGTFLGELRGICESVSPESVELIYWGSYVVAHESYDTDSLSSILSTTNPVGGGGTVLTCVSEYIKDKRINPECVVVLTDGYISGSWGSWEQPLLVCCTSSIVAPVGKTVKVRL